MKFSFKLGPSTSTTNGDEFNRNGACINQHSAGSLIVGGVRHGGGLSTGPKTSTTELGFAEARDVRDKSLKGVTALTAMTGASGFIEKEKMSKDSKKRQRSEVVIECKKKLRSGDTPTTEEDQPQDIDSDYKEFSKELDTVKGGLIVNKARTNRKKSGETKVAAPLLVRMNRERDVTSPLPLKREATTMTIIKVEADVVPTPYSDNNNFERLVKPPLGSDHKPDFTKVKVEDFGLAMLKGMGFDPDSAAGKERNKNLEFKVRAYVRGGLGSDRFLKGKKERNKNLEFKVRAYVRGGLGSDRFLKGKKEGEPDVTKNPELVDRLSDDYEEEESSSSSSRSED